LFETTHRQLGARLQEALERGDAGVVDSASSSRTARTS